MMKRGDFFRGLHLPERQAMNLADLRAAHPDLFYPQDWFDGHDFMAAEPGEWVTKVVADGTVPAIEAVEVGGWPRPVVRAVDLATLYVASPTDPVWRRFLWTDDVDRWGSRVYVAGLGQYGCQGFQIHRHLQPSAYYVRMPG